jgi:hypothetical protein
LAELFRLRESLDSLVVTCGLGGERASHRPTVARPRPRAAGRGLGRQ